MHRRYLRWLSTCDPIALWPIERVTPQFQAMCSFRWLWPVWSWHSGHQKGPVLSFKLCLCLHLYGSGQCALALMPPERFSHRTERPKAQASRHSSNWLQDIIILRQWVQILRLQYQNYITSLNIRKRIPNHPIVWWSYGRLLGRQSEESWFNPKWEHFFLS